MSRARPTRPASGSGKDAARGKLTYPGLLGVEESRRKAAELGRQAVAAAERTRQPIARRAGAVRCDPGEVMR